METANTAYPYSELPHRDSFRILQVSPSADIEADIQCDLKYTTITELDSSLVQPYIALSYVWGDASNPQTISLAGHDTKITKNLESALRGLRDERDTLHIWVDALCINQNDVAERSQQVQMMGKIYATATKTIIYLGAEGEDSEYIFSAAAADGDEASQLDSRSARQKTPRLLLRPWFHRSWVLQELVLSRDPWIQCGKKKIRWESFTTLMESLQDYSFSMPNDFHDHQLALKNGEASFVPDTGRAYRARYHLLSRTRQVFHLRFLYPDALKVDRDSGTNWLLDYTHLDTLLMFIRGALVTDSRDIIYSLLSIVQDGAEFISDIGVDYTSSCADVYEATTTWLLMRKKLNASTIFDIIGRSSPHSRQEGLRSWVVDWSQDPEAHYFDQYENFGLTLGDTMSEDSAGLTYIYGSDARSEVYLQQYGIFACAGHHLASIAEVTQPLEWEEGRSTWTSLRDDEDEEEADRDPAPRIYQDWLKFLGHPKWLPSQEEAMDFLARTKDARKWDSYRDGIIVLRDLFDSASYPFHGRRCPENRRIALFDNGELGFVPCNAQVGDMLCVLFTKPRELHVVRGFQTDDEPSLSKDVLAAMQERPGGNDRERWTQKDDWVEVATRGTDRVEHCTYIGHGFMEHYEICGKPQPQQPFDDLMIWAFH